MGIHNTKLTSPNKPLGKTHSAFFFNTQADHRSLQPENMYICRLLKNPQQNYVVFKSYTKPCLNIGSGPH